MKKWAAMILTLVSLACSSMSAWAGTEAGKAETEESQIAEPQTEESQTEAEEEELVLSDEIIVQPESEDVPAAEPSFNIVIPKDLVLSFNDTYISFIGTVKVTNVTNADSVTCKVTIPPFASDVDTAPVTVRQMHYQQGIIEMLDWTAYFMTDETVEDTFILYDQGTYYYEHFYITITKSSWDVMKPGKTYSTTLLFEFTGN